MEAKDFKKAFDLLKSHRDKANAAAKKSYADGKIDYETYLKKLNDARTEFYDNTDALFKKHELEETDELAKLHNKRADEEKEYYDQLRQLRLDAIADDRDKAQIKAEMDFYDESNEVAFKNEEYRDARLAQINLDYLKKVLKEQNLGSKEYYDAERALDKASLMSTIRTKKTRRKNIKKQGRLLRKNIVTWLMRRLALTATRCLLLVMKWTLTSRFLMQHTKPVLLARKIISRVAIR